MALPCPGPSQISLADLQTEFGGSNPIGLDEYYRNGAYVPSNNTNVPTSGTIGLNNFFCAVKFEIPIGGIIMWSGGSIPSGWSLCNGSNGTPDLRDRFITGAGGSYSVGQRGGSNSVTLSTSQMPSHAHGAGARSYFLVGNNDYGGDPRIGADNKTYSFVFSGMSAAGGSGSHENRPPYYALVYIMRIS